MELATSAAIISPHLMKCCESFMASILHPYISFSVNYYKGIIRPAAITITVC